MRKAGAMRGHCDQLTISKTPIKSQKHIKDETVWLNQQQIAVLFGTQRQTITKHLKNIFESGELERQATCSILELVQKELLQKI